MQIELKGTARSKAPEPSKGNATADSNERSAPTPVLLHGFVKSMKTNSGGTIR